MAKIREYVKPINLALRRKGVRYAIAVLAAILLLEVALRVILGVGNPVLYVVDRGEAQGGYGYIPAPDQDVRRFFAENKINSFSMRSEDVARARPLRTLRILLIGDSVTYGTTYIDQADIFASLLERGLKQTMRSKVEVLNASAGGWAPSNEINFLISRGTFDASHVVFVLNTEDLNQPFAEFEPGPNFPTQKPLTAIGELWERYIWPRLSATRVTVRDPGSQPSLPGGIANQEMAVLDKLVVGRDYARRHGAVFAIVYIPSHSAIWDSAAYKQAALSLFAWGERERVPIFDLSSVLPNTKADSLYLREGGNRIHLSAAGDKVVAESLLGSITALLRNSHNSRR